MSNSAQPPLIAPTPLLEALEVTCGYDKPDVVREVSLSVPPGGFVGLLGPNGSGKSTLLKAFTGVLPLRHGSVRLSGRDIHELSPRQIARKVAVVPQSTVVGFDYTAAELVLMGRSPHQGAWGGESPRDLEVAEQAMRRTSTLHLARRSAGRLSGGELQRVVLARALAQEPSLIILDEPTSHLDLNFQVEILQLLRELNRKDGLTVLVVLHDINLAASFCDRLSLLKGGRVYAEGTPREVVTQETLAAAYGADVVVLPHPVTGDPAVLPMPERPDPTLQVRGRIHVFCGGGSGAMLLRTLAHSGYQVSAGVLDAGDMDYAVAEELGLEVATTAPFTPISGAASARCRELAREASAVVLTDMPVGPSNLENLRMAAEALQAGKPVVSLERQKRQDRDFTAGEATRLYEEMEAAGAQRARTVEEALRTVAVLCRREPV
ncbi:MAG TPA: heme ABC transporter ATP-binding protein [Armatimonadota bacterium]